MIYNKHFGSEIIYKSPLLFDVLMYVCKNNSIENKISLFDVIVYDLVYEISNNVVCATSKDSDQPAYTHSLIRAFACRLSIL